MERGFRQVFARRARRPLALLSLPLAFAASAAMAVGPAVPASATIAGSTSVEGFANLPQFPCTSGCTGTFNGTAAGPGMVSIRPRRPSPEEPLPPGRA